MGQTTCSSISGDGEGRPRCCMELSLVAAPSQPSDEVQPIPSRNKPGSAEEPLAEKAGATEAPSLQVVGSGEPLTLPAAFKDLDLSRDWTTEAQEAPDGQKQLFQDALRYFVRALLRGINCEVLLDGGALVSVEISMDLAAEHFTMINAQGFRRAIPLHEVRAVELPHQKWPGTKHADARCISVLLPEGQFITLRLSSGRGRKFFGMCMRVVVITALREHTIKQSVPACARGAHMFDSNPSSGDFYVPKTTPQPKQRAFRRIPTQFV